MVAMEKQLIRKKKSNKISRTLQIIRLETYAALRLLSKGEDEECGNFKRIGEIDSDNAK